MKQSGEKAKPQSTELPWRNHCSTKPHAFVTMDIVWGRKIKQVGTHPARAQGGDPGLTDDGENVTDADDITVKVRCDVM